MHKYKLVFSEKSKYFSERLKERDFQMKEKTNNKTQRLHNTNNDLSRSFCDANEYLFNQKEETRLQLACINVVCVNSSALTFKVSCIIVYHFNEQCLHYVPVEFEKFK